MLIRTFTNSTLRLCLGISSLSLSLACCASATAATQAQTAAPPAVATSLIPNADPTKPEHQPNLAIDRDPILSPDAAENTPKDNAKELTKKQGSDVYSLEQNVNEVLLRCAVVDAKGNLVTTLHQRDFRVWEDGTPQTVNSFEHRDQPASIGLLIDNSGSMLDKRSAVNQAALDMLHASNPQDTAFVVNFSDRAYLDQGFTSDSAAIERGLSHVEARGMTALYDAISASADELSSHAKWPEQVLLIVTDGQDDASQLTLEQTIHRVQQMGGPVVYAIGLLYDPVDAGKAKKAHDTLETIAEETGGLAYFPHSLDQVDEIAQEVARDIRNEYVVGYNPPGPVAVGFHQVRVEAEAPGFGKLTVRTRRGYFRKAATQPPAAPRQAAQTAPPEPPAQ